MKKIVFYYKMFFAGGIESSILKMVYKLHNEYEIYVAYDDVTSQSTVLERISKFATVINLNDIELLNVDTCIWCFHSRQLSFEEVSKKIKADKYLCWGHILLFETFPECKFDDKFIKHMNKFINVSQTVEDDLLGRYPFLKDRSMVLANYLDADEIIKKSNENISLKINKEKLNIITIARIAYDKGFGRMKTICDVLEKNNIEYDWYILGKAFKKETYNEITQMFKDKENVHFLGYQENVYPFIKQMDYMAILSDREANNLSIEESLILGIPCIVSSFKGVENQIRDRENGLIFDLNNTEEKYNRKINDIIDLKDKLRENIKNTNHSKEYVIDEWKKML